MRSEIERRHAARRLVEARRIGYVQPDPPTRWDRAIAGGIVVVGVVLVFGSLVYLLGGG